MTKSSKTPHPFVGPGIVNTNMVNTNMVNTSMVNTSIVNTSIVNTQYWHTLEDDRVQCDLCPRACKLHEGQQGLCFVRERQNNGIVLTTYGQSSGFCIDPIEKKPLNHFYPGSAVLSFGTAGCNLACKFCQNWDISKSRETHSLTSRAMPEQLANAAAQHQCRSVAFTYNDPVIFMEYAIDTAIACRERDIKTVAVTAGYICPAPASEFFKYIDAANVDLKAFTEDFYFKLCGAHLHNILDTLCYIQQETDTWLELTTLLIPGKNDSPKEIDEMTRWVVKNLGADVPIHFTAFHPDWKMRDIAATPQSTLTRARTIAMTNGVRYAYTGNVHDSEGSSTYCHQCQALLIERDWYTLGTWGLDDKGCCKQCQTPLPGHFTAQPGNWGAKRQPVRIA